MSLVSLAMGTSACVSCLTAFGRQSVASPWQLQEPWGKRFEATQLSRCAAAAVLCCSQQLLQLQSLPMSEQQHHCGGSNLWPSAPFIGMIPYLPLVSLTLLLY